MVDKKVYEYFGVDLRDGAENPSGITGSKKPSLANSKFPSKNVSQLDMNQKF